MTSAGFFVISWAFHYLPFFLMSRQLFIHHYLPAHVCSVLVAGAVFNFITTETINYPISVPGPGLLPDRLRPRMRNVVSRPTKATAGVIVGAMVIVFWYLAPLTYGDIGLSKEQVNARRLLSSWTLHFA